MTHPSWGWLEVILVYLGILATGITFGFYAQPLVDTLGLLGIPDSLLTYFTLGFAIQFLATMALVLLLAGGLRRASLRELGFRPAPGSAYWKYGVLGGLLLIAVILLLSYPIQILQPELEPQTYEEMLRSADSLGQMALLSLMGVILAPLSEEMLYRGMLYPVVRRSLGPVGGVMVAGLIFGAVHGDLWRTVPLAAGGMMLCYLYEKTGSIYITTLAHGVWNGVMTAAVWLSMHSSM